MQLDTSDVLSTIKRHPDYDGQIVHIEAIPHKEGSYSGARAKFKPALERALSALNLGTLFSHQTRALSALSDGDNVMVATPAASGKSLIYNAAVVNHILEDRATAALYLFPTKALAQDQWRALNELLQADRGLGKITVSTFDGDTPTEERGRIRRSAQIVLTNPDMLHFGMLPNHKNWSRMLSRLKYVVLDEAHVYRGVFGSHVANILRRLRRVCRLYGSSPQFILCSATIANPKEHAEALVGREFEVVSEDGSPSGDKTFTFWNPPIIDEARSARRSTTTEATFLFTRLVARGIRTLAFARTRRVAELIYMYSKENFDRTLPELGQRISPYRAGYLAEDRRRIERGLIDGELLGVCATNALELGVDIGDLDATILTGYPGTIASAWQQAGRSGRRGGGSLTVMIGQANPLDQYFMRNPSDFFDKAHEHALVAPSNPYILEPHLLCAAYEWPLSKSDVELFGEGVKENMRRLEEEGSLKQVKGRLHLTPEIDYPAQGVNIRSASRRNYQVVLEGSGRVIETVDEGTAFSQAHPGAVYLHQGESFLVTELDMDAALVFVRPTDVDYYTQTNHVTDLRIVQVEEEKRSAGVAVYRGWVEVSNTIWGYKKKKRITEEFLGEEILDLPSQTYHTQALWFDIPIWAQDRIMREHVDFPGGLHAAEHAAIGLLPMFAMCDRADIGGLSTPMHMDTGKPQIFIYDGHPGGVGITEKGFELIRELWRTTLDALEGCPCKYGCPSCIQSPKCGNNNEPLDKTAARYILEALLAE